MQSTELQSDMQGDIEERYCADESGVFEAADASIHGTEKTRNCYQATQARLEVIFREFDNICVSFSGGKDSGVLLNLCIEYARKLNRRLSVFHIDYEAQYQMTTDYVDAELAKNTDILDIYRICLPIAAKCATSMYRSYWVPWDADDRALWVRELPANGITEANCPFDWFVKGMWDYDLQERFANWIHAKNGARRTASLVGIRTQESLNRWRAIHSDKNTNKFEGHAWTLETAPGCYNAYPIYDWTSADIWTANAKFGWGYNRLYDLFYQAGVTIDQMRVASPFHDCGIEALKLYKVIDPKNWGKMVGRTNGVNFAGLYGGTTAMGWRSIKLPLGHTWKSYMEFLMTTLPEDAADNYKKKLAVSQKWWRDKGSSMDAELILKLGEIGVPHTVHEPSNYSDKQTVRMEYQDDIDIAEFAHLPTYKRMCVCIMKNDHLCKFMGFSLNKTETQLRAQAESKYKDVLHG
jgi:predicted phosphoadenosine phosphosulfate sulfurtransferase